MTAVDVDVVQTSGTTAARMPSVPHVRGLPAVLIASTKLYFDIKPLSTATAVCDAVKDSFQGAQEVKLKGLVISVGKVEE